MITINRNIYSEILLEGLVEGEKYCGIDIGHVKTTKEAIAFLDMINSSFLESVEESKYVSDDDLPF